MSSKRVSLAASLTLLALSGACGGNTGVKPSAISGETITLPPRAVAYQQSGTLPPSAVLLIGTGVGLTVECPL